MIEKEREIKREVEEELERINERDKKKIERDSMHRLSLLCLLLFQIFYILRKENLKVIAIVTDVIQQKYIVLYLRY